MAASNEVEAIQSTLGKIPTAKPDVAKELVKSLWNHELFMGRGRLKDKSAVRSRITDLLEGEVKLDEDVDNSLYSLQQMLPELPVEVTSFPPDVVNIESLSNWFSQELDAFFKRHARNGGNGSDIGEFLKSVTLAIGKKIGKSESSIDLNTFDVLTEYGEVVYGEAGPDTYKCSLMDSEIFTAGGGFENYFDVTEQNVPNQKKALSSLVKFLKG